MLGTIKVYFLFPPVNFAKSCVKLKKNKKQKMQVTKRQKQKKKEINRECFKEGTSEENRGKAQNKSKSQSLISHNPPLFYSFSRQGSVSLAVQ